MTTVETVKTQMLLGQYTGTNGQIVYAPVRLGRAWLTKPFTPRPDKNGKVGEPKFKVEAIIPMDHPQREEIRQMMRAAAVKKWGSDAQQKLLIAESQDKLPIHKGDLTRTSDSAYAGALYLTASNKEQPTIVATDPGTNTNINNRSTPIVLTPSHPNWPYAGGYVVLHLDFFAYQNDGTGLSAGLLGVQFFKHGTRLQGSYVSSGSEFGVVPAQADAEMPANAATAAAPTGSAGLI